ncbi:MAG: 23S rRNA (pseudouridine(1915)-N(3))-methyltransferase RlmH [Hallerella sp.]|jgi:23S rRNA (pseudouridine1915-N3)-methyltransferase|nr:23S rRNA (pseudouridine(1915)-N(3))-methyltransferase RlmH [Fibrobacter sp.]MDY6368823.1 23S rRNA (pseudouridine(1915)-N(3))-methyltransferase RlmH [Fibrobacter sp.]MDY6389342.1 23S rRNA (pseudouridine(1915)-N(3))-methyltransferase RlmH [Fibrobacter sp.]MEE3340826.1 23S rRNA (pseudouridine(1915)-N(3))-methyltransferase RlmH [Hallerella sp.]
MKLVLAVFGKPGSPFIKDEVEKYTKRLRSSSVQVEVVEMKQSKREDQAKSLAEEAAEFSKRFPKENYQWIIMAEEGKLMNTVQLANWIKPRLTSNCVFLIGSAYGISAEIKKQANLLLSLSPLTFTHDHARVILTEQLYRCLMVIAGHPYHHV